MARLALKRAFSLALALSVLWAGPADFAWAQHDDPAPWEMEAAEYEALIEALDDLGLEPDSPSLEGFDNGDLWRLIEEKQVDHQPGPYDVVDEKQGF